MNKKTLYYSLPLFGNQFKGDVYELCQLSAKFQIWCRQFGLTDEESLALWVAGDHGYKYFSTEEEAIIIAKEAFHALPKQTEVIDVAELVKDGEISVVVFDIESK